MLATRPMNAYTPAPMRMQSDQQSNFLVDLPMVWSIFRRRIRVFFATAIAVLALVVLITFQLTPKFESQARVVLNARETQALDVSAIISGVSPNAAVVDTEVEIIRSRALATKVADELNLYSDPEFNLSLVESNSFLDRVLPSQLREDDVDERVIRERTIDRVLDAIRVERAGITFAILINATSPNPETAAQLANGFADLYLVDQLDRKFETYQLVTSYLNTAVEENRAQLRIAENAVERYRVENGLLSAEGTLLSEQQIADLQADLIIQEADLAEASAKLAAVNRRLSLGADVDSIAEVLASPVIANLRSQEADLARRRGDLETRYGPLHPQVENVLSEQADLDAQIQQEVSRIVAGMRNEVEVSRQRVSSLQANIDEMRTSLSTDNQALVRLRELEREAQVNRRNYEQLLERSQQAQVLENLAEADARVADRATLPTSPAFPNKLLNILLGVILGGAMGGLMIVLAEVFDSGVRTAADVERTLDTNLIALVPALSASKLSDKAPTPADYLLDKPLSAFAESYRTLRGAIQLGADKGTQSRVVALTSAVSGEGKTASALCLGRIAALSGDRVIIIDCDVRRRVLSARFDEAADTDEPMAGLAEVLSGKAPLRATLQQEEDTELYVLPVSPDRSGVGDLFGRGRFEALLSKLRTKFDLIILDTAPLTAVADTRMVVNAADIAVQIVRWKKTPAHIARAARKVLASVDTPVAGAVLTQVDMHAQSGYGYEGSHRYYTQHGKYYFD